MASQVTLKALGLNYSPNNLALPEGSLLVANDVIVRRDNVVESRRGFKDYSEGLGLSDTPIKQLLQYKDRIIAHYYNPSEGNKIAYDTQELNSDGQSIFNDFSGTYDETQTGLRIKSIVANKNLYFTTASGIKKLSAKNAGDFPTTQITNSGGVKALDLTANLNMQQGQLTGFLPPDSGVAYRTLWGYKDANENIIYGTPSERTLVYNYLQDIIPLDFNTLLNCIDNINQNVPISSISINNPTEITTSINHGLTNGDIVTITGTDTTNSTIGSFEVTVTALNKFTIPVNVTAVTTGTGNISRSMINDGDYYQTYKLKITDSAEIYKENVLGLAKKLDKDILYADLDATTEDAPLTIDSLQINVGSVGQINFPLDQDPTKYFEENDYIEIEGFGSEPETTAVALTHVGGTILYPENPVTITTDPNTLVNGRDISITGTTTLQSINGTYTATVDERTIISTSGGGILSTPTVVYGLDAQQTISSSTTNKQYGISIVNGNQTAPYTVTNIVNYNCSGAITANGGSFYYIITIPSDSTTNLLQNFDEIYISGNDVAGGPGDGTYYVRNITTVGPNRTFNIASSPFLLAPLLTAGSSAYNDPSITVTTPDALFTLSSNHGINSGDYVDIDGCNLTVSAAPIDGNLLITLATSGTNTFTKHYANLLTIPGSPTYGTITECIKFKIDSVGSGGTALAANDLIKIVGVTSTPSLNSASNIDNSIELYVSGLSTVPPAVNDTFYVSFTSGGDKVATTNAAIATTASLYKFITITTSAGTYTGLNGKLIEFSAITTGTPAAALNGTYKIYSASGSTFKILPEIHLTSAISNGVARECTQFQTGIAHGLSNGDAIYIQENPPSTFVSTPVISGKYYVQEVTSTTFYISLLNSIPIDLVTTTAVSNNTPVIFKRMLIETSEAQSFLENNWITISDADVPEGIDGPWQIEKIYSSTQFTILPTTNTSYTPTSGTDVGQVNRVTIPVYVDTVTVGTGTVKTTVGKNLKQFNGNWRITSVVAPTGQNPGDTKGYIQFIFSEEKDTFSAETPNSITDADAKIYSYDYRHIVNSTDINYSTTLNDLQVSAIPTSEQLRIIENNISRISSKLKNENNAVIPKTLINKYLKNYSITLNANAKLQITIPQGINDSYFYQIYRTRVFTADGIQSLGSSGDVPVVPDDEMRLVYESFPTGQEILDGEVVVIDSYPDDLAQTSENLYTNPLTGSGITQANDAPPLAKDINIFKNCTFFANTKTKQRLNPFQLIGTSNIGGTNNDKITIGDENGSITYLFNPGVQQVVDISITGTASAIKADIQDKYLKLSTPVNDYYLWFKYDGSGTDPVPANEFKIIVNLLTNDDANTVALKINNAIGASAIDFISEVTSNIVTVTNIDEGICDAPVSTTTGTSLIAIVTTSGDGEDAAASPPKVLLSQLDSRSQSIDLTARSLVRIINKQQNSPVYAYYISGENSSPGIINLESKNLLDPKFYVIAESASIGESFTPDISPVKEISGAGCITGTISSNVFTLTSNSHGLNNGNQIIISGSNSNPIIDGVYSVSNCTTNTFDITFTSLYVADGSYFAYSKLDDCIVSTNEEKQNRVYYSKLSEPEAVPLLNYFDVGSSDKAILRLMPIRDSLFVFKEDGLYRISGEEAPFVLSLFDSSCIVSAPDSVSISNNIIYAWTVKGISNISESGVAEISRPIDIEVLKLGSSRYPNFKTVTWGVGYDSDNSYTVYTNSEVTDEYATIGFRYSDLTNTWTNIKRAQNCGLIFATNDKMYTAGSEDNIIYQERKNFDRTDYSDSDFNLIIQDGAVSNAIGKPAGTRIYFQDVSNIKEGDIITQEQILNNYLFNALLDKLDLDPTVGLVNISSSSGTGSTITITTSGNHYLNNDDYVTISNTNSTPSLNGTYKISTSFNISSISIGNPTTITTSIPHGLSNGDTVTISGTNTSASTIGSFVVTVTGSNTFTIPVNVTSVIDGTGSFISSKSFIITVSDFLITQTTQGSVKRNYRETLGAETGDNLRTKITDLATYLDTDPTLTLSNYSSLVSNHFGNILSNTAENPTKINTSLAHELVNGRLVTFGGVDNSSIPSLLNKTLEVTVTSPTQFTVPLNVTTAGTTGLTFNTSQNDLNMYDMKACFNALAENLNLDIGATFNNYKTISNITLIEAVVTNVNYIYNYIEINLPLFWTNGKVTIYKSIPCELVYAPITFGDPLSIKQVYEATMMFDNKAFTKATASFNTDLKPQFLSVDFYGQGNGIFGHYSDPGFGYGFFGGMSNSAPFRTIVPRESQRCRFLTVKFEHNIGREKWALNGITLTGNMGLSSRGYR